MEIPAAALRRIICRPTLRFTTTRSPTPKWHVRLDDMRDPIWAQLTPEASRMVRLGTYERLFDAARGRVRAWEAANVI